MGQVKTYQYKDLYLESDYLMLPGGFFLVPGTTSLFIIQRTKTGTDFVLAQTVHMQLIIDNHVR